jgi:sigma-B regulation protein RsbU (phosphoserine phosphatase)
VNRTGDIVGVLELMNRIRPLTAEDESFLAGVSVHIGLALENAQLHREIVEKRRIEQELALAREIQQNFYPDIPQSSGGVEISASCEMCEAVGGDYLGYFPLADRRFLVTLGDVSGKGISAALVMASLHAACRALVRHVHALEHITSILNETFVETTSPGVFITLLLMLVDPHSRRIHYISAGHNPPLIVGKSGHASLLEKGGGPPIGLFANLRYPREIAHIESGSAVIIYTDGVSEAENAARQQFGVDRLTSIVTQESSGSAAHIHGCLRAELREFMGEEPTHDDSTLVVMKFP